MEQLKTYIDPIVLEKMEEHKLKEFFKLDKEWVDKMAMYNPEGYRDMVRDWKAHEEDARFWRTTSTSQDVNRKHLHGKTGWTEVPTLIVPKMLYRQMEKRFGPEWGSFNFIRYCLWNFYPKLRTSNKYNGHKKGISKNHISANWNE